MKFPKGPPKWSVLPKIVESRMTTGEKKAFHSLVKKEREASFHPYRRG